MVFCQYMLIWLYLFVLNKKLSYCNQHNNVHFIVSDLCFCTGVMFNVLHHKNFYTFILGQGDVAFITTTNSRNYKHKFLFYDEVELLSETIQKEHVWALFKSLILMNHKVIR